MAFVLTPEGLLPEWLDELDAWTARSPGFFSGRTVVLDLSATALTRDAIADLVAHLTTRGLRVMGFEGVDASVLGPDLPPLLSSERSAAAADLPAAAPSPVPAAALVLDSPVRSGQSILYPDGDVIVLGSVGYGAEIIAGGSIHIYGTLRGRAMAGAVGNPNARIFCRKVEAELMAIDGYYKTADDMDQQLRGQSVQAWLENTTLMMAALS